MSEPDIRLTEKLNKINQKLVKYSSQKDADKVSFENIRFWFLLFILDFIDFFYYYLRLNIICHN